MAALVQPWEIALGEHFAISADPRPGVGRPVHAATTALAFLAGHSSRLRVSSNASPVPLQHPVVQAKEWGVLAGSAAAGPTSWWGSDGSRRSSTSGVDFSRRGRLCDEYVAAMIEIWTSDHPVFEGRFVRFDGIRVEPRPVQKPHVPPLTSLKLGDGHVARETQYDVANWNVQELVDLLGWLGDLGVTEVTPAIPPVADFEAYLDRLRWVAEEVMPELA